MLKILRMVCDSNFWMSLALCLGYSLSAALLKGFIPDSWATPGTFLSGVGFFCLLRWIRTEEASQQPKTYSPLLQAIAFAERAELNPLLQFHRKGQGEHIEGIVARAAMKLEACAGPKGCHSLKEKIL